MHGGAAGSRQVGTGAGSMLIRAALHRTRRVMLIWGQGENPRTFQTNPTSCWLAEDEQNVVRIPRASVRFEF